VPPPFVLQMLRIDSSNHALAQAATQAKFQNGPVLALGLGVYAHLYSAPTGPVPGGLYGLKAMYTATTIGYGDIRPTKRSSKFLSIFIGFAGLKFSGILVAVAVHAATIDTRGA
jgi:Ion channel